MNDYYDLGMVAAVTELEKQAAAGDAVAKGIMGKLPEWLKGLPGSVKEKAVGFGQKAKEKGMAAGQWAKEEPKKALSDLKASLQKGETYAKSKMNPSQSFADALKAGKSEQAGARKRTALRAAVLGGVPLAAYGTKKALD